ncbi:hypothetical protein BBP40_007935 [Aspergillus hancockii]|nr:hypothetical protein BBP40_007935 [Aspergillus hancockii]
MWSYKIVNLAVAQRNTLNEPKPDAQPLSVRETALWKTAVPERDLYLNEALFAGPRQPTAEFQPLLWFRFGGPKGSLPPSLVQMSAIYPRKSSLKIFTFCYVDDDTQWEDQQYIPSCGGGFYNRVDHLLIDGPGGEHIKSIEKSHDTYANRFSELQPESFIKVSMAADHSSAQYLTVQSLNFPSTV